MYPYEENDHFETIQTSSERKEGEYHHTEKNESYIFQSYQDYLEFFQGRTDFDYLVSVLIGEKNGDDCFFFDNWSHEFIRETSDEHELYSLYMHPLTLKRVEEILEN